jgi:transcription initiation factor TFIIE subunit alpha
MKIDILREVVSSVAGEKARGIIDLLVDKKNVNEFLIAKKLKLTINQTRNILYKLADDGLVSFIRKKDSKKGGWYTYFWTLNHDRGLNRYRDILLKNIENLKKEINSKKTERFFFSQNCGLEFTEENALVHDYTCPECGEILQLKDNSKEITHFEKEVKKNEALLEKAEVEIKIVQENESKIKVRRLKAEEKKKQMDREEKRKKRQKEMKKSKGKVKNAKSKKRKK